MKILMLCNKAPYPANDGSSVAVLNMAQGLVANAVEVHLLCINTRKHYKPDNEIPNALRTQFHYKSVYRNTNTGALGALLNLFSRQSYFVSRFKFKDFKQQLLKVLTETKFDIIQLEGVFMACYLPFIRTHCSSKIVLRAHNIEHHIWERHLTEIKNPLKKLYLKLQNARLRKFEFNIFSSVDMIVPISEKDTEFLHQLYPAKPLYTCISGLNMQGYLQRQQETHEPGVFSFGSMDWLPNQEAVTWFMQKCWQEIKAKVPEAKLVIAGKGMPEHIKQLQSRDVKIVPNVPNAADMFNAHQILIVPLRSGSGLRIKVMEGMAHGKTIVSTTIGAEGIGVTHRKDILIANTPEQFSAAVVEVLTNAELRKQLAKNAAEYASTHFDNQQVTKDLLNFYNRSLHD